MVLETFLKLWIIEFDFMQKMFSCKNLGDGPKAGIFGFIEKVGG